MKLFAFGFLSWLIPFVVSIGMFDSRGTPILDPFLTHNILMAVGNGFGGVLIYFYFRKFSGNYRNEGIKLGIVWMLINLVLDLVLLVSIMHMDLTRYINQIGVGYLNILIIPIIVGFVLEKKAK